MALTDLTAIRPAEGYYTSEVQTPRPLPVRTFLPVAYEPRYPYPLLVFFHGHGGQREQILRLALRLSRRNFISIGLRGPVRSHPSAARTAIRGAGPRILPLLEDYLCAGGSANAELPRPFGRIYLAGFAEGATLALPPGPRPCRQGCRRHFVQRLHAAPSASAFCGCPSREPAGSSSHTASPMPSCRSGMAARIAGCFREHRPARGNDTPTRPTTAFTPTCSRT